MVVRLDSTTVVEGEGGGEEVSLEFRSRDQ